MPPSSSEQTPPQPTHDALTETITAALPPLLHAMEGLGFIARHLHPPRLAEVIAHVGALDKGVADGLGAVHELTWPEDLHPFRDRIVDAATSVLRAYEELRSSLEDPNGAMMTYRALRHYARAQEALFPLARLLPPLSRFFLDEEARDDAALLAQLKEAGPRPGVTGLMHFGNEKQERGGFSLYVPETYDPARRYPLVFALHGGSGHGRDFMWSWLRTARAMDFILVSPTSVGSTWSLMEPDEDAPNLARMLDHIQAHWSVDPDKVLLTGMSDGGTYTYVNGITGASAFTHLAPISSGFHPLLLEFAEAERLQGLPLYLVHGAQDWMFPVDMARTAARALSGRGVELVYREIKDLSHTYPREENSQIARWFLTGERPDEPDRVA